jgi:hypothetical protein
MPGGVLTVHVAAGDPHWQVTLSGPVVPIASGWFAPQWIHALGQ